MRSRPAQGSTGSDGGCRPGGRDLAHRGCRDMLGWQVKGDAHFSVLTWLGSQPGPRHSGSDVQRSHPVRRTNRSDEPPPTVGDLAAGAEGLDGSRIARPLMPCIHRPINLPSPSSHHCPVSMGCAATCVSPCVHVCVCVCTCATLCLSHMLLSL